MYLFLWKEQALGSMPLSVFYPYLKHMQMVSSRGQVSVNLSGDIHAESVHYTSRSQMRMGSRAGNKKAAMMRRYAMSFPDHALGLLHPCVLCQAVSEREDTVAAVSERGRGTVGGCVCVQGKGDGLDDEDDEPDEDDEDEDN